ncbi:MAG: PAS domain S-box protein [Alphaproteobacteria bacterium]
MNDAQEFLDNTIKLSTPGERLKYIRALTQLSRAAIREKFRISDATLRSWEDDKVAISENKIKLCLEAYKRLGIITTTEWVKFGIGLLPSIHGKNPKFIENYILDPKELQSINKVAETEFLEILISKSPSLIFYVNQYEKITYVNEKFQNIFELPTSEMVGLKFSHLLNDKEYEIIKPSIERLKYGLKVDILYPYKKHLDEKQFLKLNLIPYKTYKGVMGFYAFIEDHYLAYNLQDQNIEDMTEGLLKSIDPKLEFKKELFFEAIDFIEKNLLHSNVKLNFNKLTNIASAVYAYSIKNNKLDINYTKNIIEKLKNLKNL